MSECQPSLFRFISKARRQKMFSCPSVEWSDGLTTHARMDGRGRVRCLNNVCMGEFPKWLLPPLMDGEKRERMELPQLVQVLLCMLLAFIKCISTRHLSKCLLLKAWNEPLVDGDDYLEWQSTGSSSMRNISMQLHTKPVFARFHHESRVVDSTSAVM